VASNGKRLLGAVTTLASVVTAMVAIVYSCSSGKNVLTVSFGGAVPSRFLAAAKTQNERNRDYDVVQVQGFAEDYRSFNGYYNRAGCSFGVMPCWLSEKTVLYYDKSVWKIAVRKYFSKNAVAPDTKNGKLPLQEAWKLLDGRKMQITIKGFDEAKLPGFADADGEQTSISDHENEEATRLAIKHLSEETGLDFEMDNSLSSDGFKQSTDVEANGEVGSGVHQTRAPVMTNVSANHPAERNGLNGEISSDVDQSVDPAMTSVDANHSGDQPAQHGEVGSVVDQVMTGVNSNHSADAPGPDELNGQMTNEIPGGEKGQQNSSGAQSASTVGEKGQQKSRSNHSGAQSTSTAKTNMTNINSSSTHSIPSPAEEDLKGELQSGAFDGNKSQPKPDSQKNSNESPAEGNQSGIAKSDPMKHDSKNRSLDQTNRSSLSRVENLSTSEQDYQGGNSTNTTLGERTEVFSFHSILAILTAVFSLMCACVCMAVSCFWRGSEAMLKEKDGHWDVENSETEAILP